MKKHFAFVLSFWLVVLVLGHHTAHARDSWISVRSRNFLVIGNGSENDTRNVALKLEQFREAISQMFPRMVTSSPVPTSVIVFKSDSSYRPFKVSASNAGYFQPGADVNYITLTTDVHGDQDPFTVIFHEYTHLLVNNTLGSAPTWFNEGLAEYFSTFSIAGDQRVTVGKPISSHVYLLRRSPVLPLRTMFQVDHKSPYYNERDKQSIFYAQSWALIHYLLLNNNKRAPEMARFIDLMSTRVPLDQAFSQAFSTSFEAMESELREYIRQDRYRMMQRTFGHKLEQAKDIQSRPISEAEAMAHLGDLLLHGDRPEAETYLLKALSLDPKLLMAHASLGVLRFRQGRPDEARVSLERAVAANSQNYLVHYYYAYVLGKPGKDDGQPNYGYPAEVAALIRSELKKAIALRPDFPESYNLLAFVNLVTNTDLDETITMLKRALERLPGRIDFMYMLGQIYMNKDNYRAARPLLEQVATSQQEEKVRNHARKLIVTMSAIEEDRAKRAKNSRSGMMPASGTRLDVSDTEFEQLSPVDPSSVLREALRQPAEGETQLQGSLLRMECGTTGFIFVIKSGNRVLRLKTDSFRKLGLITYDPEVRGEITCGARNPSNVVVVCYLPLSDHREGADGVLKSLAFVPSDFQLRPAP